nr:uncharacterized protein LOC108129712 [Drosophila bipectinata]
MEQNGSRIEKSEHHASVPSFQKIVNDLVFTYASPQGSQSAMDYLGSTIRSALDKSAKEGDIYRIVLICQQDSEAATMKEELEKRNVSCLQISEDHLEAQFLLWSEGYIQEPLIICDNMLSRLQNFQINFVIYISLPPLQVFNERIRILKQIKTKMDILILTPMDNKIKNEKQSIRRQVDNGGNPGPKDGEKLTGSSVGNVSSGTLTGDWMTAGSENFFFLKTPNEAQRENGKEKQKNNKDKDKKRELKPKKMKENSEKMKEDLKMTVDVYISEMNKIDRFVGKELRGIVFDILCSCAWENKPFNLEKEIPNAMKVFENNSEFANKEKYIDIREIVDFFEEWPHEDDLFFNFLKSWKRISDEESNVAKEKALEEEKKAPSNKSPLKKMENGKKLVIPEPGKDDCGKAKKSPPVSETEAKEKALEEEKKALSNKSSLKKMENGEKLVIPEPGKDDCGKAKKSPPVSETEAKEKALEEEKKALSNKSPLKKMENGEKLVIPESVSETKAKEKALEDLEEKNKGLNPVNTPIKYSVLRKAKPYNEKFQYHDDEDSKEKEDPKRFLVDPPISKMLIDRWPYVEDVMSKFKEEQAMKDKPMADSQEQRMRKLKEEQAMQPKPMDGPIIRRICELKKKDKDSKEKENPNRSDPEDHAMQPKPMDGHISRRICELRKKDMDSKKKEDPKRFLVDPPISTWKSYVENAMKPKDDDDDKDDVDEESRRQARVEIYVSDDILKKGLKRRERKASELDEDDDWDLDDYGRRSQVSSVGMEERMREAYMKFSTKPKDDKKEKAPESEEEPEEFLDCVGELKEMDEPEPEPEDPRLVKQREEEAKRMAEQSREEWMSKLYRLSHRQAEDPSLKDVPLLPEMPSVVDGDDDAVNKTDVLPKESVNQYGVYVMVEPALKPCYEIHDIYGFGAVTIEAMRQHAIGRNRAYGMQRFAWPHIVTGNPLIIVGHELTGKTMSYLPQIYSVALNEMSVRSANDPGPTAIIIVYSQVQGRQIATWIEQLMKATCQNGNRLDSQMLVTLYERGNLPQIAYEMNRRVGILLITANMMLKLKKCHSSATPILRAETVKCVALDNFGELIRIQPVTTEKLVTWLKRNYCFNGRTENPCQLMVTGRVWDDKVHPKILRYLAKPLIIFEDALEATACMDVKIELRVVPDNADTTLIQMLGEINLKESRTVVVCQSQYEAIRLRKEILKANMGAIACYQENTGMPLVVHWRTSNDATVLIVTDDIMPKIRSGVVDIVIHYNAATTWVRFKARFGLFYDSYVAKRNPPGKSYVLVRRTETDYIWLLCDFMLKHQYPRPSNWMQILFESRLKEEEKNGLVLNVGVCRQVSSYGDCFRRKCRYRHYRWVGEKANVAVGDIRVGDTIQFHVLTCNSPSMMAIRLNDGRFPVSANYNRTSLTRMRKYLQLNYEDEKLHVKHQNPKPGDIVVVKNMNRYERVLVISIDANNKKVEVRLIDSGIEHLTYNPSQLLVCDPAFLEEPHEAIELHIIGLEPISMERIWAEDLTQMVREQFFPRWQRLPECNNYSAQVKLIIDDAIYVTTVDPLEGEDLRSFVMNRFDVNLDPKGLNKLRNMVDRSIPNPFDI